MLDDEVPQEIVVFGFERIVAKDNFWKMASEDVLEIGKVVDVEEVFPTELLQLATVDDLLFSFSFTFFILFISANLPSTPFTDMCLRLSFVLSRNGKYISSSLSSIFSSLLYFYCLVT